MKRPTATAWFAIWMVLTVPDGAGAVDQTMNFLITDLTATSNPAQPEAGTLFLQPISTDGDSAEVFVSEDPLRSPTAAVVDGVGRLAVVDRSRRPDGIATGTGAIIRFDRMTRTFLDEFGSESFRSLSDVALAVGGDLLVVDREADPLLLGGDTGAIFRVDDVGTISTFSADASYVDPVGVITGAGRLFIVDENADPLGHGSDSGCIWEVDPTDGSLLGLFTSPPEFSSPRDGVVVGSTLYVVDRTADSSAGPFAGNLFAVDLSSGTAVAALADPDPFATLIDVEVWNDTLYLLDRDATFGGFGGAPGGIYAMDLVDRVAYPFASSPLWSEPQSLLAMPPANIFLDAHELTDVDGGGLNPGDVLRVDVSLSPIVTTPVGFTLVDTLEAGTTIVDGSIATDTGSATLLSASPPIVSWTGTAAATATLTFDVVVPAIIPLSAPLASRIGCIDETGGAFQSTARDTIVRSSTPEELLVTDSVSFFSNGRVGIVRAGGDSLDVVLASERLFNPAGAVIDESGVLFFADRDADVDSSGTFRGALFRFDVENAAFDVFAADTSWIDPIDVDLYPDGRILLLDQNGGPAGNPGSGALFVLDGSTGAITGVVTDPRFTSPSGLHVTAGGDVLIADRDANPNGFPPPTNGAIFRVSPSGNVTLDLASSRFRDPVGVLALDETSFLVADANANPFNLGGSPGAVFIATPNGFPTVVASSGIFAGPTKLVRAPDGAILFSDTSGRILRIDATTVELSIYLDSPDLISPDGLAIAPYPLFWESAVTGVDVNGGKLVAGDIVDYTFSITNTGRLGDEATASAVAPPFTTLDPGSVTASSGIVFAEPDGRTISWAGSVASGQTVDVGYSVTIGSGVGMETAIASVATVTPAVANTVTVTDTLRSFGSFLPGDLVVLDFAFNVPGTNENGSILRRNRSTDRADFVAGGGAISLPTGLAIDAERRILIVDRDADPFALGGAPGAVFRYDASVDLMETVLSTSDLVNPVALLFASDGRLLLLDQDADPNGTGGTPGAVFEVDLSGGTVTPFASDSTLVNPIAFAETADGSFLLLDRDAVLGGSTGRGALFRVTTGGSVIPLGTPLDFSIPSDMILHPDGSILVADRDADPAGVGGSGTIFRLDAGTFAVSIFAADPSFVNPVALGVGFGGEILVVDTGNAGQPPAVWQVDESDGSLSLAWAPPELEDPRDFVLFDAPLFLGASLQATDLNGPPLVAGDRLRYDVALTNGGVWPLDPLEVEVTAPDAGMTDPASIDLSPPGPIKFLGDRFLSLTSIAPGDSLDLTFEVVLDSDVLPGAPILTEVHLDPGAGFTRTLQDEQRIPFAFAPNDLLLLDRANALLRWDDVAESITVIPTSADLVSPEALLLDVALDVAYVVDSEADLPGGLPSAGGLLVFGARDGRLLDRFGDPRFEDPMGAFIDVDGRIVVVDSSADPDSTGASGALFSVDPATGDVELRVAHPSFVRPMAGIALADGTWLIVDADADPGGSGGNVGTIFRVDPEAGTVVPATTGGFLVDPVAVGRGPDARLYVVDENADVGGVGGNTGTVFEFLELSDVVVPVVVDAMLVDPKSVRVGSQGELYLSDVDGSGGGRILRHHPADDAVIVYAEGPELTDPIGVEFFDSPTPTADVGLSARIVEGAVVVAWRSVPPATARIDLMRRGSDSTTHLLTPHGLDGEARQHRDDGAPSGEWLEYWLGLTGADGASTLSHSVSVRVGESAVSTPFLGVMRPNPTGAFARFWVTVPAGTGPIDLAVFDVTGRRVRTLLAGVLPEGRHAAVWDLKDDADRAVGAGVFFIRFDGAGQTMTRRVVVVR